MTLSSLRLQLDQIDGQLLQLVNKRQQVIVKVAKFKKQENLKINQPQREQELISQKLAQALSLNLNPLFVKKMFRLILAESKRLQRSL